MAGRQLAADLRIGGRHPVLIVGGATKKIKATPRFCEVVPKVERETGRCCSLLPVYFIYQSAVFAGLLASMRAAS
jgi:hypothetical protein